MKQQDDDVRALFDLAYDGELSGEEREAFDKALSERPELRAEYERFREVMQATAALSNAPEIDLLSGVQQRLRARSGGRFYRDRFAELRGRGGALSWVIGLAILATALVAIWLLWDVTMVTGAD